MSFLKNNIIYDKSLSFAIRIVNLCKYLTEQKSERVISKQILRSGTSIGANISESIAAESQLDFIHKLAIAQKETLETIYWLTLLHKTDYLSKEQYESLLYDCNEIKKLLVSIAKTMKQKLNNTSIS